jgi:ABC-type polysaccharide/polyol phosphate transport system ATPase subunit
MSAEIAISVRGLKKSFKAWTDRPRSIKTVLTELLKGKVWSGPVSEFEVLRGVSFDIRPGEFVGIMGKNGAGKSTMLKLISGIYVPNQGEIVTRGVIAPLIELGAGFHPDLTGYENIFLIAAILGFGKKATMDALDAIIDFSGIAEHLHRPVRNYSSGMLVRLGFAIATHLDADVLLVDEVLAVGDHDFQSKCISKIQELHQAGKTVILITHDANAVRDFCQRCIVIDSGIKVYDGDAQGGVKVYLGQPN